jgi:hypothetical protein
MNSLPIVDVEERKPELAPPRDTGDTPYDQEVS